MHLQVKVKPGGAIFSDDDVSELITNSADYERGSFRHILQVLAEADFNIRGASGHRIEFGGEFTFWVSKRDGDADHEAATEAAAQTLIGAGLDARVVSVSVSLLNRRARSPSRLRCAHPGRRALGRGDHGRDARQRWAGPGPDLHLSNQVGRTPSRFSRRDRCPPGPRSRPWRRSSRPRCDCSRRACRGCG